MNQPDPNARPSQVTVAGWAVAIASVLLLIAVFDTMGRLESVDMRERLTRAITSGSAKGFGFSVDELTQVLRACLYVSGVAAAASGILGVFVLQGHRGARIALSVTAVAIVLTASVAGSFTGFLGMFIGVGAALLWTGPARDWFAGRPVRVRPAARRSESPSERASDRPTGNPAPEPPAPAQQTPPVAWSPPEQAAHQPPPTQGWGQPGWSSVPPTAPVAARATSARPAQVRLACILTWIFSGFTALGYAAVLLLVLVDRDRLVEELRKTPGWKKSFDADTITTIVASAAAVFVVWSLVAIVLAVLVWRRVRWAWVLLVVSAWAAGLVSVLAFPFSLPYLAAIGASAGMLMRRPTRAWFAAGAPDQRPPADRPAVW